MESNILCTQCKLLVKYSELCLEVRELEVSLKAGFGMEIELKEASFFSIGYL